MDRRIVQSIDESDEEELEALRLAALRSRRQTESYTQKRQSQRNNKKDIRRVSLGCGDRSVVQIGSPRTDECVSSSSSTDYEEIDLSGTSPGKRSEYFQTYPDSEESENVFVKEDSISGTPSDFENVEENGNPSGEEQGYFDSDITQDQSLDVETEAGIVDNLTITFSNEAGESELGHRTSSVNQSYEEEEDEGEDEDEEEEKGEELGVAIEDNSEEELASTSGSDFTEQQPETRESQVHTSHTRIIIADLDSEEEEVDLMYSKGRDTKENALFNKSKQEVSVNGPLGPNKYSSEDLATKTVMQKENAAASSEHLMMEDPHSKSTFVAKIKKKENETASSDNFSKESPLSKSKHATKAHGIKDSAPKKVKQKENERASSDNLSKEYPLSNSSAQKNHKQKEKYMIHDNILKKDSLSKAKTVNETPPQVRDQLEKEGRKNSPRTRSSENAKQKITTKIASIVTSQKCVPLKTTLARDSVRTAPEPKKDLDIEDNDADRLSIGTSDEDNEFEQSEEQQPAIKSKVGWNKMAVSSNSHTASRDRSRHRRSRSHDKSNLPRKSWSHDRDHGMSRSYERSWTHDGSGTHDRSESRGRTRYNHSPTRSRRAHVHDRSREQMMTYASNQWRHSEHSELVDRRKDRRSDRWMSTRSRSRERHDSQRSGVANRDKRNERKRSWSFDSPSPPIKSKPTVNLFGNKPTNHKGCSERTSLNPRFEKNTEKDKIQPNEKQKHSKPRKEIKTVLENGQKKFVCTSLPTKQDVKEERKRSKDESDLRVKLKDPPRAKTVEKTSSKSAVHTEITSKGLPNKTDEKKIKVTVVQKTSNNEGEEELNTRIAKIRQKNKNILKRAREVEADREKATHSRSRIL